MEDKMISGKLINLCIRPCTNDEYRKTYADAENFVVTNSRNRTILRDMVWAPEGSVAELLVDTVEE
jgi:hypothetical protein